MKISVQVDQISFILDILIAKDESSRIIGFQFLMCLLMKDGFLGKDVVSLDLIIHDNSLNSSV